MAQHNLLGSKGEMLAARFLLDKGYAVLHYNWRSGHKEIDLIAKERDTIVFVEVKSRSSEQYGNAADAVLVFGKYIMDTHIKDGNYPTNGIELGHETAVGEGMANFPLILQRLKDYSQSLKESVQK